MPRKHLIISTLLLLPLLFSCQKEVSISPGFYTCQFDFTDQSTLHPRNSHYQALLDSITRQGVPGIIMAIHKTGEPVWMGASGMADIANRVAMQSCNISRAGSVVKTFTAVTVLLLAEEGKINLDEKISAYLTESTLKDIANSQQATVRQLLNHSSGIYNYIQDLRFQTVSLNDLVKVWQPDELLHYARKRKAYFQPGTDIKYSNTSYVLLGMLIEKVTGKHFSEVFRDKLFLPLGLKNTSFNIDNPILDGLVRGYVDMYSDLNLVESTQYSGWDYYTADGGLISNPYDLSVFIQALFAGKIISQESITQMQQWHSPKKAGTDFFPIEYGLGILRIKTPYGEAIYHSGDAIGYYGCMLYFPDQNTSICWQVNGNYGKIDQYISSREAMNSIFKTVFE